MATGDEADIVARQKAVLPQGWFSSGSPTPVLDARLHGLSAIFAWIYGLLGYTRAQTRISTSTDGWLEIGAVDYFGDGNFDRLGGESDTAYANRILANILPKADTRAVISAALTAMGITPLIVEPWNPWDTGVYGSRTRGPSVGGQRPASVYYAHPSQRMKRVGRYSRPVHFQAFIDTPVPAAGVPYLLYVINRLKVEGTIVWIRLS